MAMKTVKFFNIAWDTDGQVVENLPHEVTLAVENDIDVAREGAAALSDKYGYCVLAFNFEICASETMKETVYWHRSDRAVREAVCKLAGALPRATGTR